MNRSIPASIRPCELIQSLATSRTHDRIKIEIRTRTGKLVKVTIEPNIDQDYRTCNAVSWLIADLLRPHPTPPYHDDPDPDGEETSY